ncbi:MAG TPA: outer membrane beta-barrel family protein, partial [Ferruginibacter sp.]|nr:outer membrane beta-barrel family protein [Ferruginibacter sp.]
NTERYVGVADKSLSITVMMKRNVTGLSNVVVVAKKPLVKQEDDKTIVDAEVLAQSSTNAYEVLERTPGAIVDQDGNVYLNSNSPATIQINGREVKLSAADLASLLKSLPAGSVSKIEILRNPSAKYDAESSGGIVNIVLKKGVKIGTSGTVNVGYFQGVYATNFAGVNLNRSVGKINSYFSYQVTKKKNFEELNSNRLISTDNSTLFQTAYTTYPGLNNYFGAGVDVELNKKLTFGYDLRFSNNRNSSDALNQINIVDNSSQSTTGKNESLIKNSGNSLYISNEFSLDYKIDSSGSLWSNELNYNFYNGTNNQDYTNNYFLPAQPSLIGDGHSRNRKNIFVLQSDLVLKTKNKFTIETGVKSIISDSRNAADYFKEISGFGTQVDSFQTNGFRYKENINSAYLQVAKSFFGFTLKPGLRLESTNITGHQLVPKDTSFSIQRTDLFPYVFLRHRIMKLFGFELNGNLVYRRSITRPYYESLNPYPKYVDQYLFDVGNPALKPQFTTNYEFNIVADEFPVFSIGINKTKDIFSNVTYQDDSTKIAFRTYDNIGKSKELYLRFVAGLPPGGKYFFYAGGQHNYVQYNGLYEGLPLSYNRGSWTFFMFQSLKVNQGLTITAHGFFRTRGLQNFYELENFGGVTLNFNKTVLKKKANLILTGNDIFYTNKYYFKLNQGNVSAAGHRINDTRRIGLTFRYNFGIKPKEEKKPAFEQPAG